MGVVVLWVARRWWVCSGLSEGMLWRRLLLSLGIASSRVGGEIVVSTVE